MTASAATAGYQGQFKVATVALIQITSCEITANGQTYDVTVMSGSSTPVWQAFISGLRNATIKVSGLWDQVNDAVQATLWTNFNSGASFAISFSPNAGSNTFSGNAIFTSLPMKFPVGGAETVEWDLQVTGALSYA